MEKNGKKINLGSIEVNDTIRTQLEIVKSVTRLAKANGIKVWFNGTYGVIGYWGSFFSTPNDVDCGVLSKYYQDFIEILKSDGYLIISEKENSDFKVTTFEKNNELLELGTFDCDLGDNYAHIEGITYPIPDSKWLANCYRITYSKEKRRGKNDLERAMFLESVNDIP